MLHTPTPYTVDAVGVQITAGSNCSRIRISNRSGSSTDFYIKGLRSNSDWAPHQGGEMVEIKPDAGNSFYLGELVGYVKTSIGTDTFRQIED